MRSRAVVCVDKGDKHKGDVFKNRKDENNYSGVALVGGRPAPGLWGLWGLWGHWAMGPPARAVGPQSLAPFQSTRSVRTEMTSKDSEKAQVSAELQQFIAQEQAKAQVRFLRVLLDEFSPLEIREAGPPFFRPPFLCHSPTGSVPRPSSLVPHSSSSCSSSRPSRGSRTSAGISASRRRRPTSRARRMPVWTTVRSGLWTPRSL